MGRPCSGFSCGFTNPAEIGWSRQEYLSAGMFIVVSVARYRLEDRDPAVPRMGKLQQLETRFRKACCSPFARFPYCNWTDQAIRKPWRLRGSDRYRCPVAANNAFATAGITVTGPTSPVPPSGRAPLSMK